MGQRALTSITFALRGVLPGDWLSEIDDALDFIKIDPSQTRTVWDNDSLSSQFRFVILRKIEFDLPLISGATLRLGRSGDLFDFNLNFTSDPVVSISINELEFTLHLPANIIQEYVRNAEDEWEAAESEGYNFTFETGLRVNFSGEFNLQSPDLVGLPPFMISDTGFILDFRESRSSDEPTAITFVNSEIPDALIEKVPLGFKGLFIERAFLFYNKPDSGTRLPSIGIQDAAIGSGGFSGNAMIGDEREDPAISEEELNREGFDPSDLSGDHILGFELAGMQIILWHLRVSFTQSIPDGLLLTGLVYLSFAEKWMKFKAVAGGPNADFMLEVGGAGNEGLVKLEHELFEIKVNSVAYKTKDGIHYAIINGSIKPKLEGFDWPEMVVNDLSISSQGDISIPGGWLKAPEEITLDFHAFKIGISEIGFGNEGEDPAPQRQWLGFSGSLNLVEGLELKASVEGLRFSWLKEELPDGGRDLQVSLEGIGVEFEIPNTLSFEGSVKYEKLTAENNGGTGLTGELFKGNINLNLMAVRLQIEAELMIGKLKDADGNEFTTFFIVLGAELPAGLPLGATGTSLYGMKGLAGIHAGTTKTEEQNWYQWYLAAPERNITSIRKWKPIYDHYGFGAGVKIGTMFDDGFTINMSVMLVVLIPGPVIILEGKANLLKQRSDDKDEEGAFYLLAVLDGRAGTFMLNIDVRYSLEDVITVGAGLEAFFDFNNSENWYIYIGRKEPEAKRIRAEILSLFKASAYFMIDSQSLKTGASVGLDIRETYGPVSFALVAKIRFDAAIFWKPLQLEGELEMRAELALKLFGIGLELYMYMLLGGKVPEPYRIYGVAEIGIKLFWPIPDLSLKVEFEWVQPGDIKPVWPLLKECSFIHHKGNGTTWAMTLAGETAPDWDEFPIVPVDARPVLTFARPIHNLKGPESGGLRLPLLKLLYDEVGGKKFVYNIHQDRIVLEAFDEGRWKVVKSGINTGDEEEFTISKKNIINLQENVEPNEPQIQLWRQHVGDIEDQYRREDYNDRQPACNPTGSQQWFIVNWQGVENTSYDYNFYYSGLYFLTDEFQGLRMPQVSGQYLFSPDVTIHFPEPVYQVAIYFTQEVKLAEGTASFEGNKVGDLQREGSVLYIQRLQKVDAIRITGKTLIIGEIRYMTERSVVDQAAETTSRNARETAQNVNGALHLKPSTYYRLSVETSVNVNDNLAVEQAKDYVYFRTDDGPGIPKVPASIGNPGTVTELSHQGKEINTLAAYIERTLPNNGAKNHYYAYDIGVQFNESYVEQLFSNGIHMRYRDRNGKLVDDVAGSFLEGFLPLVPWGLLTWIQHGQEGACQRGDQPEAAAPYLNFSTNKQFKPHELYSAEMFTETELGEQILYSFQFNCSRYATFEEHLLSSYPEGLIQGIELPAVTVGREPFFEGLERSNQNVKVQQNQFSSSIGALNKYKILAGLKNLQADRVLQNKQTFEELDNLVLESFAVLGMEDRPLPDKFEIFRIPLAGREEHMLLLESPEPIQWDRLSMKVMGPSFRKMCEGIFNEDQTRAFLYHKDGHLFPARELDFSISYSGEANPITGIVLQDGVVVRDLVRFSLV